ncbi:MAG: hypothetical protein WCP97_03835 [bacterium]
MKKTVTIAISALTSVLILSACQPSTPRNETTSASTATNEISLTPRANEVVPKNSVMVGMQQPGTTVLLSLITLEKEGWVAIHENDNEKPGKVIGSQYFGPGASSGVITVNPALEKGKTYFAVIHSDDGDKKFDAAKDLLLKDDSGNIILKNFLVLSAQKPD